MVDFVLKTVILSETKTGVSKLIYQHVDKRFSNDYKLALGMNLCKKIMRLSEEYSGKTANLQLWDIEPGWLQKSPSKYYLSGAQAGLFIFDVASLKSFRHVDAWIRLFIKIRGAEVPKILIGYQKNPAERRIISDDAAKIYGESYDADYLYLSPRKDHLEECLHQLTMTIMRRFVQ